MRVVQIWQLGWPADLQNPLPDSVAVLQLEGVSVRCPAGSAGSSATTPFPSHSVTFRMSTGGDDREPISPEIREVKIEVWSGCHASGELPE